MSELDIEVVDWLGASLDDPVAGTLASLRITVGPEKLPLTEVEDTIAKTVRSHINVSAYAVVRWLLVNWWRLRWEPRPNAPSADWFEAHSMAAIGGDFAWPAIQFSSDGEFIQIQLAAETSPDVSALRYLRNVNLEIPAAHFERAVERLADTVEARLATTVPGERELVDLRSELRSERADPALSRSCKLQALAGFDPGAASAEWLKAVAKLTDRAGEKATQEILAAVPEIHGGLDGADQALKAMALSPTTIALEWATVQSQTAPRHELPWERGARLARELRQHLALPSGAIGSKILGEFLEVKLPLPKSAWSGQRALRGGFRNGVTGGRTGLLVTAGREDDQRFYLGRLIGAALLSSPTEHLLPVSDALTALQKYERSFSQELLCPWADLDTYTDDRGTDGDAIAEAAEHFGVQERVVLSALVNKKKLPRYRLQLS